MTLIHPYTLMIAYIKNDFTLASIWLRPAGIDQ
jgi:hypothetical protein